MMYRIRSVFESLGGVSMIAIAVAAFAAPGQSRAREPEVLDPHMRLTLIAEHPQIVTPIGCAFDHLGRLLVVESHTHFPPDDYNGPKSDRIRILIHPAPAGDSETETHKDINNGVDDRTGDGPLADNANGFETFYDGLSHTMSIVTRDEWVYLATRKEVFRIRDTDGDGKADARQSLVELRTDGDYPHNGLGGLAFDRRGRLLFGLGENLGRPYELIGSDGTRFSGGGEGGNVYRCKIDGAGLERIATGFWNPFGICTDPTGRIFAVGNDPDARPPCRLVHVVEAGDYGYQFRFGRSGMHPLQAWDGELPGTLPMVAGTGEAPSAVVPYAGRLWVTSWGDYRIERFRLKPRGASFEATREIVVQGDNHFRPVDFAIAPDGSLVFTDWVQKSYPVHGQGRVWRLSRKDLPSSSDFDASFPSVTEGETKAATARAALDLSNMDSADPFIQTATIAKIAHDRSYQNAETLRISTSKQWMGMLAAARWDKVGDPLRSQLITKGLADDDPDLQLYAVRWIAEEKLVKFRPSLQSLLRTNRVSLPLFEATVAAIEWLDHGTTEKRTRVDYLADVVTRPGEYSAKIVVAALRVYPIDRLSLGQIRTLLQHADRSVQIAATRSLALSTSEFRKDLLQSVLALPNKNAVARADAEMGLRLLARKAPNDGPVLSPGSVEEHLDVTKGEESTQDLPLPTETDAWLRLLGMTPGDADRGWRVFFGAHSGRCADCHTYQGRGADIGPDLTEVTKRLDQRRLVESILQPSREVAPRYTVARFETDDGAQYSGMSLGASSDGVTEDFVSPAGDRFSVEVKRIDRRELSDRSLMPDGFEKVFTVQQLRDLTALLSQ